MENVMVVTNEGFVRCVSNMLRNSCQFISDCDNAIFSYIQNNYTFMKRDRAEKDVSYRQIIPYVFIQHARDIFTLTRLSKQSETRLHGKKSIGIGGHINPSEQGISIIQQGLERELYEEMSIDCQSQLQYLGVIIDDTTEVSRVHIGIVFKLLVENRNISIVEKEKMSGEWLAIKDLINYHMNDNMESWSQILLKQDSLFV